MKKILSVILFSLIASALSGCNSTPTVSGSSGQPSNIESSLTESVESKEESSKTEQSSKENVSKTESSKEEISETENSQAESSEDEQSSDISETESSSDEEQSSETEESEDENSKEDDSIFSFRLSVDGVEYKLPFDYSELNEVGYYLEKSGTVEPNTHTRSLDWKDGYGHKIAVQLWNPTDKVIEYDECKIGSMEIKLGEEMNVVLPGDFSFDFDVTPESVKEQYGEPESEHIYDNYVTLRYKKDLSSTVEFFIYTDETMQKFSSVTVKNFV